MIKRAVKSFGHAREGLIHALRRERNLQVFAVCYAIVLVASALLRLDSQEWIAVILAGGTFIAVELLNTALERLTDAVDELRGGADGYHAALKAAKDIAAAASLISLIVVIAVIVTVLGPHLLQTL